MNITERYKELKSLMVGSGDEDSVPLIQDYRRTFNTEHGRRVLTHMLAELHFFDAIVASEEEIALSNYARLLLNHLGVWDSKYVPDIVNHLMSIPVEGGKNEETN